MLDQFDHDLCEVDVVFEYLLILRGKLILCPVLGNTGEASLGEEVLHSVVWSHSPLDLKSDCSDQSSRILESDERILYCLKGLRLQGSKT